MIRNIILKTEKFSTINKKEANRIMKEIIEKYCIDTEENKAFLKEIRDNLLDFGHKFPSPGGSSYYLGDDGTPWKERNRETWITCRMAHVYSIGVLLGHKGSRALAKAAIKGLKNELHDKENGGWYPGVTSEGKFLMDKQCYAHAFVILAASSARLAEIDGAEDLLEDALALFERRFWDEKEGLTLDTWNTAFTVLSDYRGLNANMHTVEAYLATADATGRILYRTRAGRIINHVIKWASDNDWRIPEHFTKEWEAQLAYHKECPADPFKPYGATPGHGIEWARLIIQWALSSQIEKDQTDNYIKAAENLYQRAVQDAWNADGAPGLVYTTDWEGKPVIHDRMHWTLAEAINTSAVLYRVTKDKRYADDYGQFLQYLDTQVLDHKNGSWFHQMNEKGEVTGSVWPGKSDIYHAFQACLIPYERADMSIASAIYIAKQS